MILNIVTSKTEKLFNALSQIRELYNASKYNESLALIDKMLISDELLESGAPSNARIHFLYAKAVALDMSDRLDESLPLFFELARDYPGTPEFESSLNVVLSKLEARVKEQIKAQPDHSEIRRVFEILEKYSSSPYWLIHAVAAQEVAEGKIEIAWKRIEKLLALSPNDSDYLRCALSLAKSCGKVSQDIRITDHIKALLEEKPYRLDLVELLEKEL